MTAHSGRPGVVTATRGDSTWSWAAVEITAAYDLSKSAEYTRMTPQDRLEHGVREQAAFVDQLLAISDGNAVTLRWIKDVDQLRLFLIGRSRRSSEDSAIDSADELIRQLVTVPGHVDAKIVERSDDIKKILHPFVPAHPGSMAQIGKRLRVQKPSRSDAGISNYLAVEPFSRHVEDWTLLLGRLATYPHQLTLTVVLEPTTIGPDTRRTLESEATRYRRLCEPRETTNDLGGRRHQSADSAAATIAPIFNDMLQRYAGRLFRFSVTLASPEQLDETIVAAVGRTISAARHNSPEIHEPQAIPTGYNVLWPRDQREYHELREATYNTKLITLPDYDLMRYLKVDDKAGERQGLADLRSLVDRTEALSMFRLPLATEGHVPGFPVRIRPDRQRVLAQPTRPAITIGYQGGELPGESPVSIEIDALSRHGFIVGTPGSGKTNTALHLCQQLWQHNIPFLVVEPVNSTLNDYRWLATQAEFDELVLLTVGDEGVAPFRLNPFEVPKGATVSSHVSNLLACFEAAFGLWDPLPFIYRRALIRTYRRYGLHADARPGQVHIDGWPTLVDFICALSDVVAGLGYSGEIGHNIEAASILRAEALAEGACGGTLDCRRSFNIETLLRRPVVVELAGIGDNAKEQALMTLLLLNTLRSHRRAAFKPGTALHVVLLEEAHRVFPRAGSQRSEMKEGDARALAAERIAQGLAEDRKYRQSYILIDQQVGKVSEDAYKITNLKVMHRTSAAEDRRLLGDTMSMQADQLDVAAGLAPFWALVSHNALDQAVSVKVPDVRGEDAVARGLPEAPLANDELIRARHTQLLDDREFADAMAPFDECHACKHRCKFRRQAESIVANGDVAAGIVSMSEPDQGGWPAVAHALRQLSDESPRQAESDGDTDFQTCIFIHAFRNRFPASAWTKDDRRRAIGWADRARKELEGAYEDGTGAV